MTGYGRGTAETGGHRVSVEIRSVNHRFFDLKLRGGPMDPGVEEQVGARLRHGISRGALSVTLRVDGGPGGAGVRVDLDAARRVHRDLLRLAAELSLAGAVGLDLLCAQPGVLLAAEPEADTDALAACAVAATDRALAELVAMRTAEGETLARDLGARLAHLRELTDDFERLAATQPADARRRLSDRIARLLAGSNVAIDDARLAQEVALLADRLDVTEELVRLRSHIEQAVAMLAGDEPVGRRLDFLVQEIGREVNTIGSKAQSGAISHAVVDAKAELEKVREQVQNVE